MGRVATHASRPWWRIFTMDSANHDQFSVVMAGTVPAGADMTGPCRCWVTSPPLLHEGHCCFMDDPRPLDELMPGDLPACGHWHSDTPRPEVTA